MQRMFDDAADNAAMREDIRKNRLYGIELQDKLFAIGTTNMILRGDGKANFRRDSIFEAPIHEMRGGIKLPDGSWAMGHGFTKVLLNPPYSQSKDKSTRNLSELSFIERALSFLNPGGKLAVIVPQSAMVGKTKEDKARKNSRQADDPVKQLQLKREARTWQHKADEEAERARKERHELQDKQDEYIDLIGQALKGTHERTPLFSIRWEVTA